MSRPRKRLPLPGPEYRYDSYGLIIKRKRGRYGPKHSQFNKAQEITGDFSGNNENAVYADIPCKGGTINCFTAAHVAKAKALADASGNPRIWTAADYTQAFLRSLIPL